MTFDLVLDAYNKSDIESIKKSDKKFYLGVTDIEQYYIFNLIEFELHVGHSTIQMCFERAENKVCTSIRHTLMNNIRVLECADTLEDLKYKVPHLFI